MTPGTTSTAHVRRASHHSVRVAEDQWPVEICLLGGFRLFKAGEPLTRRAGGKIAALLSTLALSNRFGLPRETLMDVLWPNSERPLASRSLNTLVYSVHCLVGDELGGAPPILTAGGAYRLNTEAGMVVDVARFDKLANAGDLRLRSGDQGGAANCYVDAVGLYRGDLCVSTHAETVIERERLRSRYLTLLSRLATYYCAQHDYAACLDRALELLRADPCREDAHRLAMLCYVRQGERAQAIRQFRLCERVLRTELDAPPEAATIELFDHVRLHPERV